MPYRRIPVRRTSMPQRPRRTRNATHNIKVVLVLWLVALVVALSLFGILQEFTPPSLQEEGTKSGFEDADF